MISDEAGFRTFAKGSRVILFSFRRGRKDRPQGVGPIGREMGCRGFLRSVVARSGAASIRSPSLTGWLRTDFGRQFHKLSEGNPDYDSTVEQPPFRYALTGSAGMK